MSGMEKTPSDQEVERAREWIKAEDLKMLLGCHIGASGDYLCELLAAYSSSRDAEPDKFGDNEQSRHMAGIKGACARATGFPKDATHGYAGRNQDAWIRGWEYANDCLRDPNYKPAAPEREKERSGKEEHHGSITPAGRDARGYIDHEGDGLLHAERRNRADAGYVTGDSASDRDRRDREREKESGASVNYLQVIGGLCFAHGEFKGNGCPKWPACITAPQIYKPKESGEQVKRYYPTEIGMELTPPKYYGDGKNYVKEADHLSALSTLQDRVKELALTVETIKYKKAACGHLERYVYERDEDGGDCAMCDLRASEDRVEKLEKELAEKKEKGSQLCVAMGSTMMMAHELRRAKDKLASNFSMPLSFELALDSILTITTEKFCMDADEEYKRLKAAELSLSTLRSSFAERAERAAEAVMDASQAYETDNVNAWKAIILAEFDKEQQP